MIVNTGLNLMRDFLAGDAPTPPSHFAVGTSETDVVAGDTTLGAEVERKVVTTKTISGNGILEYVGELLSTEANGNDLAEVGVLNAAAAGDLLLRTTHAPYSKTASFAVKYVVRHTLTNV